MPVVDVEVRGHTYTLACDVGQEEQIKALGRSADERIKKLSNTLGRGSDIRLFVMAIILMEDEIRKLKRKINADNDSGLKQNYVVDDQRIATKDVKRTLDAVTDRLEKIASFIEEG